MDIGSRAKFAEDARVYCRSWHDASTTLNPNGFMISCVPPYGEKPPLIMYMGLARRFRLLPPLM